MQAIIDFYNSPLGRKIINWGVTSFGLLISGGIIPLDAAIPVLHISVGTLLTVVGLRLPSHSIQGPIEVAPSIKGTGEK